MSVHFFFLKSHFQNYSKYLYNKGLFFHLVETVYVRDVIVIVRSALLPSILATFQSRDLGFSKNLKNSI